ncbi:MAG: HNH endonuclease [Microbacterium sp.]|uniref:HNH endonuclease n=1 Tax=Microbacterium sp. TaxID=51671 RepID=UPI000DB0DB00|nr:HNH endonuclease signature motif containing protein [Microbacterium sp.]PZU40802.1 MAG: HNH endonuclease [Microbacterium sp.]
MDTSSVDGITEALRALVAAGGDRPASALSPAELMAVGQAFGALKRHVDAAFALVAAEISRQSRRELGKDSLAKRQGFASPAVLISTATGTSVGEAVRIVQVGEATAPRMSLAGEALPAKHPHVAGAVSSGRLGVTAAAAIVSLLDRLSLRIDAGRLDEAECQLVALAPGMRPDELSKLLARAEAHLDPDGIEPRHEQLRSDRSLVLQERDGMLVITGRLDPETGAPVKAAIDTLVGEGLRRNEHGRAEDRDQRSVRQMQADALADLCRHAVGCAAVPMAPTATVVVRVDLADLQAGVGSATIDGFAQPVPASTVRRMAADAQVIPCVLGGESEILDWGRARRLFTPAQKLAVTERDGGCVSCGAPPAWCHVHHLAWWERDGGRTDLGNGVLLCTGCHHRLHADGWEIRIDGPGVEATVWLVPPPWVDARRTPRLAGRSRYTLTA